MAAFFGGLLEPSWLLKAPLGPLWVSFGAPWGHFLGSLEVLLAAVGCLRAPLGLPGGFWVVLGRLGVDFRNLGGFSGGLLDPFSAHFCCFFVFFVGHRFLIDF